MRPRLLFPLLFASALGCAGKPTAGIGDTTSLVVFEGLPNREFEPSVFKAEGEAKATREVAGFLFYREPLPVGASDLAAIRALVADPKTLRPFSGEKKCGGFHPDDAVEWREGGVTKTLLLCFSCGEARLGSTRYDLAIDAKGPLRSLMYRLRKQRHEWKKFG